MLLHFAYESRVDLGYRLLDRCARHACDPRTRPLIDANAMLFKHKDKFMHYLFYSFVLFSFIIYTNDCSVKIGMIISHKIRASMKDASYDVTVAFTSDELVCCKCNCKAGCEGIGKAVCVHVFPLILSF